MAKSRTSKTPSMESSSSNHRSGTNTSELFICFTSRNNMKASSKSSILSPGRARDPPICLSTSLSRRLKTSGSGSIKNGQASPMFPTGCKKRGSGFENPEPSSPKVTCIGQVRVKTKKQGEKMRNLSRRRSGEMSFRKIEHNQIQRSSSVNSQYQECSSHRNQRWLHLPLTICETLRGLGSEFSCLFPCKSSCFSGNEREKEERESRDSSSCGAVFAAVQEDGGKGRDIELVVGEEEAIFWQLTPQQTSCLTTSVVDALITYCWITSPFTMKTWQNLMRSHHQLRDPTNYRT